MKAFEYDSSPSKLIPFFLFLVRRSFLTLVFSALLVSGAYFLILGSWVGAVLGAVLTISGYLLLLFGVFWGYCKSRPRVEVDEEAISLVTGPYSKVISWDSVLSVEEKSSLVWTNLLAVYGPNQRLIINLPLILDAELLLDEIRQRVPSSKVNGTWSKFVRSDYLQ